MDLEKLLQPISEDAPCGPDLEPEGDPQFDEAYFDRMGELPEFYYRPGVEKPDGSMTPDNMFDPKSVNFRDEIKLIDPVLERSKDLRLVVLRAHYLEAKQTWPPEGPQNAPQRAGLVRPSLAGCRGDWLVCLPNPLGG